MSNNEDVSDYEQYFSTDSDGTLVGTSRAMTPPEQVMAHERSDPADLLIHHGDAATFIKYSHLNIWDNIMPRLDRAGIAFFTISFRGAQDRFFPLVAGQGGLHPMTTPSNQLDFLTKLARDLPDHYVCEQCLKLHKVDNETEGFAADIAFVENASHEKKPAPVCPAALEMPCQRKKAILFPAFGSSQSLEHTFTGGLSSVRRTPLAGLLHRDVELTLKRARLLKYIEDKEQEELAAELNEVVLEESRSEREVVGRTVTRPIVLDDGDATSEDEGETVTTVQEVANEESATEEATAEAASETEEMTTVHASTNEAAAELAEAGPSTAWARPSKAPNGKLSNGGEGTRRPFRKNGWMAIVADTVASTANAFIPERWRPQVPPTLRRMQRAARQARRYARQVREIREQELRERRKHLETTLHASLRPITADVSLEKIDRISRSRYPFRETTTAKYTFAPRIQQGHYLLKTTIKLHRQEARNVALSICPHQLLNYHPHSASTNGPNNIAAFRFQSAVYKVDDTMKKKALSLRERYELGACGVDEFDENEYESDNDVPERCKDNKGGMRQRGSCHRCATDFCVRGLSRKIQIIIVVWQDFGEETCMTDINWQSHIPGDMLEREDGLNPAQRANLWDQGPEMHHLTGGVRALYEDKPLWLEDFGDIYSAQG
ncbi:hypothetical protein Sste5346_007883 [Sporothrix stenoceras]|uniref:Uncharacterized protein n=1 Tax=Sporothrix stenoceras TaxID=5173 RepID=A0ABR3YSY0_9PEZI